MNQPQEEQRIRPDRSLDDRWALEDLKQLAGGLTSAGIGLSAIGQILNETDLSKDEENGLQHAVIALGDYLRRSGYDAHAAVVKLQGGEQ